MKISDLSLPLPVLGVHDDVAGQYDITGPSVTPKPDIIEIALDHVLRSREIQNLIDEGKAEFVTHVHCRKTAYRKCFKTATPKQLIEIKSDDLRDKVELEFFVIASAPINNYRFQSAHKDYEGFAFNVEVGEVMAYGGATNFVAEKQWMAAEAVGSFMVLQEGDTKRGPMKINLANAKIAVILAQEDFRVYQKLATSRQFDRIFHSVVVLPALIYAVSQMIESSETYEEWKWCQVLEERKTNDPALSGESWEVENAPVIAQKLLGGPLTRTLDCLVEMTENAGAGE